MSRNVSKNASFSVNDVQYSTYACSQQFARFARFSRYNFKILNSKFENGNLLRQQLLILHSQSMRRQTRI